MDAVGHRTKAKLTADSRVRERRGEEGRGEERREGVREVYRKRDEGRGEERRRVNKIAEEERSREQDRVGKERRGAKGSRRE
mgnify:CR=1 FL=1